MVLLVKCGRLGVKNCGRWEIGGKKLWEVGDWGSKIVGGGRWAPLCHPPQCMYQFVTTAACQAWYYPDPESICVTYRGIDSSGTPIPTGATSMQISGEYM